ncbi:MAG: response regulator [Pseudomonadota bacterium]
MAALADSPSRGIADAIAPSLPLLRRYARALAGTQKAGDAYVAATLEAVIADRSVIDMGLSPRVGLYKAFQRVFESASFGDEVAPAPSKGDELAAAERLASLTPSSRRALLLTAVEGFDADEAAAILDVSVDEAASLVDQAVSDLRDQTRARILIIEDEPIIAMDIESVATDLGHEVVQIADTRSAAVAAAREHGPDLVLADIQLADGSSGIDAVRDILGEMEAPVIFITAYPERLLTGLRPEPTFLIAKPFLAETLQATISQALFFRKTAHL